MLITIMIFSLFVKLSVSRLIGTCNQCFATNNVACLNETHFATCFKGLPTATITKCPTNCFCTDDKHICHTSAEGLYTPACYRNDYCSECVPTKGSFTCLDETTYGNCYGGTVPLESSFRSCPQGYVCNYNSSEICVPAATDVPSCSNKTTSVTDISTSTQPGNGVTTNTTIIEQTTTTPEKPTENTTKIPFPSTVTEITTITTTTTTTTKSQISTQTSTEITTSPTTTTSQVEQRDADTICGEIQRAGNFPSNDPTCRQYLYCYFLSGQCLGLFYYCNGYFNVDIQDCQTERPLNCVKYSIADEF